MKKKELITVKGKVRLNNQNINKDKHKYAICNSSKSTKIMNQSKDKLR